VHEIADCGLTIFLPRLDVGDLQEIIEFKVADDEAVSNFDVPSFLMLCFSIQPGCTRAKSAAL
jgi:hypothetical protein